MWALLPVKHLSKTKLRLSGVLTRAQRRQLSCCMVEDILDALHTTAVIDGITVVSCDETVMSLAAARQAEVLNTGADHGYAVDVSKGVEAISNKPVDKVIIIPADVPELDAADLACLDRAHKAGVTLCPADKDGGTNALVFTPPLAIRLMYGDGSFDQFRKEAKKKNIPVTIAARDRLSRDIDRPDDLLALQRQPGGGRTWRYVKLLNADPLRS